MIFWRSPAALETLQPPMTTQSAIKESWAALSHPRRTSQLHCLQHFLLTRIVGVSPGPSPFLGIEPFTLAELQEAMFKMPCGCGAGGDGLVLELFTKNMALLVYMFVGILLGVHLQWNYGQHSLIYFGDTRCSQWFRNVGICNKPKTGDR